MYSTLKSSNRSQALISRATKEAEKSTQRRCRHGALLVRGGNIIGAGYNTYKTHASLGRGPLRTLHAEAAAIRDALRKGIELRGAAIYVARHGDNKMSRPCSHCQIMLLEHGIKKIVYTNERGEIITEYPLWKFIG